uniref:hypothetical protein n=1 Tax=Streptomyces sp. NRRL F-5053 TaxID=1463854 RepID=UPI00056AE5D1
GFACVGVVECDLVPGQAADAVEEVGGGLPCLGGAVGTAFAGVSAVSVLGVCRVGGDDRAGQADAVQQGPGAGISLLLSVAWRRAGM